MNILVNTTGLAHYIIKSYITNESICIDATCGRGNDSLFLANNSQKVYCFDIQKQAIDSTEELLSSHNLTNYQLIHDSFVNMREYIKESVDIVMFNLGYLPNGDKSITTQATTTISGLKAALELLKVNGLISITTYWGHQEGKKEREDLLSFVKQLDKSKYHVVYNNMINQTNFPPELILITKKK